MRNLNFSIIFFFENIEKGASTAGKWSGIKHHRGGRKTVILFISKRYHISIKNVVKRTVLFSIWLILNLLNLNIFVYFNAYLPY